MKVKLVDRISDDDGLQPPTPQAAERQLYSEWHHFNFNDEKNGLYGIYNLVISGDVHDRRHARACVTLVVYERGRGWQGTMNLYPIDEAEFAGGSVDLVVGESFVRFVRGEYRVGAALRDGSLALEATFTPQTSAVRVTNVGGLVSYFVIPRLVMNGSVTIDGASRRLERVASYHDHNWGYWHWGLDVGWDWGFVLQDGTAARPKAPPMSLVFGRVTDGARDARSEPLLMVWAGEKFSQVFMDRAVKTSYSGTLDVPRVRRVPGLMDLIEQKRPGELPQRVEIEVEDGSDRLSIRFEIEDALQFLIPHPQWRQRSVITELVGEYRVAGELEGLGFDFSFFGFAELAG